MSKRKIITYVNIAGLTIVITAGILLAQTNAGNEKQLPKLPGDTNTLTLNQIHAEHLPMALKAIDKALKAIESGEKSVAIEELNMARSNIVIAHEALGHLVKPVFANNKCPIMGSPINPDKIGEDLIREFKGQKVAFCCAGCPVTWDKLSDAQKEDKLNKVKIEPSVSPQAGHIH
ncbi:MAG: hypothetical protein JW860_08000 [Sedimentisphaerales bacterium]|nr:hypothetical protein [Sedimentisphaerales bacterium]